MTNTSASLITFGISHFCEKACWALGWHDIDYNEISWPPGLHQILSKRCGAKRTTLPIVRDGEKVVHGSDAIIDWADAQSKHPSRQLTKEGSREIEECADSIIGWHVRRLAYAEILPRFPQYAKPGLFQNASRTHRFLGDMMWPVTRRLIMQAYGVTDTAAAESRSIWKSNWTSSMRSSATVAPISRGIRSVEPMLQSPACSRLSRGRQRCLSTTRCHSPMISRPTVFVGKVARSCVGSEISAKATGWLGDSSWIRFIASSLWRTFGAGG